MVKITKDRNKVENFFKDKGDVNVYICGSNKENKFKRNFKKFLTSTALVTTLFASTMVFNSCEYMEYVDPFNEYGHVDVNQKDIDDVKSGVNVVKGSVSDLYRDGNVIAASEITSAFLKKDGVLPTSNMVKGGLDVIRESYPLATDNEIIALSKLMSAHLEKQGDLPTVKTLRYYMVKLEETSDKWGSCDVATVAELASARMKRSPNGDFPHKNVVAGDINSLKGGLPQNINEATATDYTIAGNIVSAYIEGLNRRPSKDDLKDCVDRLKASAPIVSGTGSLRGLSEMAGARIVNTGSKPSIVDLEYDMAVLTRVINDTSRTGMTVAASNIWAATMINNNSNQKIASFVIEAAKMNKLKQGRA